ISSRTTCFSLVMSSLAKRGRRTRSASTSNAMGRCSSSTLALKQIISLAVKASSMPPTESTAPAISSALRRSVPLKTMCSMKCEMPFRSEGSRREPVRIQMPTETERTCGIRSVMTTRPLGRTSLSMSRRSSNILFHPLRGSYYFPAERMRRNRAGSAELKKLFLGAELAVLAGVVQRGIEIGAPILQINFAAGEGSRVHVNAHCAAVELRQIDYLVHGLDGIHCGGMVRVHVKGIGGHEPTGGVSGVASLHAEVLHTQAADRHRHPAVLIAVVVDAARLADVPADGHGFE